MCCCSVLHVQGHSFIHSCFQFSVEASDADKAVFDALPEGPSSTEFPHLARWYNHIAEVKGLTAKYVIAKWERKNGGWRRRANLCWRNNIGLLLRVPLPPTKLRLLPRKTTLISLVRTTKRLMRKLKESRPSVLPNTMPRRLLSPSQLPRPLWLWKSSLGMTKPMLRPWPKLSVTSRWTVSCGVATSLSPLVTVSRSSRSTALLRMTR